MFKGTYSHTIDEKGRVRMPTKFRDDLGEVFTVTRGSGRYLFVFPEDEWKRFEIKLRELPLSDKNAQTFIRVLLASACDCSLDKQGRILLPQNLREHAKLENDVVVIGAAARAEIWSKEEWEHYNEVSNEDFENTLAQLAPFGI